MLLGLQVPGAYTKQQTAVLLSGDDYWKAVSDSAEFESTSSTLAAMCAKAVELASASESTHLPATVTNALADYEAQLVFADVTDLGYQEVSILINSFGVSNFDKVLRLKPWIWNIDPYKTSSDTMTTLRATIKALIASDAVSYTDTEWMTVTNPLAVNYAATQHSFDCSTTWFNISVMSQIQMKLQSQWLAFASIQVLLLEQFRQTLLLQSQRLQTSQEQFTSLVLQLQPSCRI